MSGKLTLSFGVMAEFLGGNSSSRNIIEGECVLKAGLVVLVGAKGKKEDGVSIFALVLQTSGITKSPLQITGELKVTDDLDVNIANMTCSCKAGMSEKCKHIGAVLWYLILNDINDLEELSSTDLRCIWAGERKKNLKLEYEAKRMKSFCCVKQVSCIPAPWASTNLLERAHEMLLRASPGSAFQMHKAGRLRDTTGIVEEGPSNAMMCDSMVEDISEDEIS